MLLLILRHDGDWHIYAFDQCGHSGLTERYVLEVKVKHPDARIVDGLNACAEIEEGEGDRPEEEEGDDDHSWPPPMRSCHMSGMTFPDESELQPGEIASELAKLRRHAAAFVQQQSPMLQCILKVQLCYL